MKTTFTFLALLSERSNEFNIFTMSIDIWRPQLFLYSRNNTVLRCKYIDMQSNGLFQQTEVPQLLKLDVLKMVQTKSSQSPSTPTTAIGAQPGVNSKTCSKCIASDNIPC
jgi:hypothetical protein